MPKLARILHPPPVCVKRIAGELERFLRISAEFRKILARKKIAENGQILAEYCEFGDDFERFFLERFFLRRNPRRKILARMELI